MDDSILEENHLWVNESNSSIAILLSAGIGKRLRPLTLDTPKPLLKIGGLPIIIHQLQAMAANGIGQTVVVLGYKSSVIKDALLSSEYNKFIRVVENPDYNNTNNLYSLYLALRYLEKAPLSQDCNRVILGNGDIVFDRLILTDMLREKGNQIAVDVGTYCDESMKIAVDDSRRITEISKEIPEAKTLGVSIDLYSFDLVAWKDFKFIVSDMIEKEHLRNVWTEHALQRFFDEGKHEFIPLNVKGRYWFEIDTLEDLKEAERRFSLFQKAKSLMSKRLFIFDLDGTVLLGNTVLPNVIDCLNILLKNGKTVVFLTNNSSFSKQEHLDRLNKLLGIELNEDSIRTSIDDTIKYLSSRKIQRVFLLATPSVRKEFLGYGFSSDSGSIDALVVAFDKTLSYEKLEKASCLLSKNRDIAFVLTNGDLRCPTENGFVPDAGGIGRLLEVTTGRKIDVCRGKPNPEMITDVVLRQKLVNNDCVFFGDRLYTDIKMGYQSGVMTVLMLTGETKIAELDLPFFEKHLVFNNYKELLEFINGNK